MLYDLTAKSLDPSIAQTLSTLHIKLYSVLYPSEATYDDNSTYSIIFSFLPAFFSVFLIKVYSSNFSYYVHMVMRLIVKWYEHHFHAECIVLPTI